MKARKSPLPEDGYACGLVLKAADFSVHVPLAAAVSADVIWAVTAQLS